MKVKIKRIDSTLPVPVYETDGAVGFDILARENVLVPAGGISLVPSNLIVSVPEGYMLVVASRSSTPRKKGLSTPHGFGIIDHDYCGPEDEIKIQVFNFTDDDVEVARGDKIAQGVFVRIDKFELVDTSSDGSADGSTDGSTDGDFREGSRGGFGSTG